MRIILFYCYLYKNTEMDTLEIDNQADNHISELFEKYSKPKNIKNTNNTNTSNGKSTSAKSKKTTTKKSHKRTASRSKRTRNEAHSSNNSIQLDNASDEDVVACRKRSKQNKSVKRLKQTSTKDKSDANATIFYHFDHRNGVIVSSRPKINPAVSLESDEREVNTDEVASTKSSQDSESTVQTVLQTSQNGNNVENNLIDDCVMIIGEIPARNRKGRNNNLIPLNDDIITIPEDVDDDDDGAVEIIDGPSTSSYVRRRTTKNSRKGRTYNEKHPKSTTITINEEENDNQTEISSKDLRSCPICLDSFKDKEISATICGHVFCKGCILAVIATNKKCPTCRTSLTKKKIHPLFI